MMGSRPASYIRLAEEGGTRTQGSLTTCSLLAISRGTGYIEPMANPAKPSLRIPA